MSAKAKIVPVFVPHLGCPHDCVFCNQRRITGKLRPVTAEDVKKAIKEGAALGLETPERQLAFYGGSFTAIPAGMQEELLGAAQPYLKDGTISSIRLSTRPDAIDAETLERLRAYGVSAIELGAQSMLDDVLKAAGRGHGAEDTVRASRLIKAAGFTLILQMMTGLPGSTPEKDLLTAERIAALSPHGVRIYPTVVIRDTGLYDMWVSGEYAGRTVEDAVNICAEVVPLFEKAAIKIIRLGLNPTDELSKGGAVAGAYHPALGELVYSRIMLNKARALLGASGPQSDVVLGVAEGNVSKMTGQRRANIEALKKEFSLKSLQIKKTSCGKDEIIIL